MSERLNQNRSGKEGMATGMKKDALISCLARFHELRDGPTDRPTDRPTDKRTDTTFNRCARTQDKTLDMIVRYCFS